jgi:hypothetical protein
MERSSKNSIMIRRHNLKSIGFCDHGYRRDMACNGIVGAAGIEINGR